MSLASFLLRPVQRLCRYPLLVRELVRLVERSSTEISTQPLRDALLSLEQAVARVNEATRERELFDRLQSEFGEVRAVQQGHLALSSTSC